MLDVRRVVVPGKWSLNNEPLKRLEEEGCVCVCVCVGVALSEMEKYSSWV